MSPPLPYACPKCQNTSYESDEIRTTGQLSRFFNVQNKKFITVSCQGCSYTELYKKESSGLGNIADWFLGG